MDILKNLTMIIIEPMGGLCNRLRALDSAISLKEGYNTELRVVWILNSKCNLRFKLLNGITLIFFVLFLVGCTTTNIYRVKTENIAYKSNYEIINVIMKNGVVVKPDDIIVIEHLPFQF